MARNELRTKSLSEALKNPSITTELDLSDDDNLRSLPEEIGTLTALRKLDVMSSGLATLPESIGALKQLTHLDLRQCKLTSLPESIGDLPNLEELQLSGNAIRAIPSSLVKLTRLRILDGAYSALQSLPEGMGSMTGLAFVDLRGNEISELSPEITSLKGLKRLNVSSNRLTSLPSGWEKLKALQLLDVGRNLLTSVPADLGKLRVRYLDLSWNQLTALPVELGKLSLSDFSVAGNPIDDLPDGLAGMRATGRISLWLTRIPQPRTERLLGLFDAKVRKKVAFSLQLGLSGKQIAQWAAPGQKAVVDSEVIVDGRKGHLPTAAFADLVRLAAGEEVPETSMESLKSAFRHPVEPDASQALFVKSGSGYRLEPAVEVTADWKKLSKHPSPVVQKLAAEQG
jgi:Leucine-rich repeat (LRR) protein